MRTFNARPLDLRALGIALTLSRLLALCRPLALLRLPRRRLPLRFLLALKALAQLILQIARRWRLLTLLTRLIVRSPPLLRTLNFALLQGFALVLALTALPVAILPNPVGDGARFENR